MGGEPSAASKAHCPAPVAGTGPGDYNNNVLTLSKRLGFHSSGSIWFSKGRHCTSGVLFTSAVLCRSEARPAPASSQRCMPGHTGRGTAPGGPPHLPYRAARTRSCRGEAESGITSPTALAWPLSLCQAVPPPSAWPAPLLGYDSVQGSPSRKPSWNGVFLLP